MTLFVFILVLVALIVVHEFGHFVVAKLSGMRVDEFGIGYPPRAWGFKKGETEYTLNWLPFGGFVKIFGEDMEEKLPGALPTTGDPRSFSSRPRILQALVLVAGITMNLLLAYVLITATLVMGTPRALETNEIAGAKDVSVAVAGVLPGSPAALAGLTAGDYIKSAQVGEATWSGTDTEAFTALVAGDTTGEPIAITIVRGEEEKVLTATPTGGIIAADPERKALGVQLGVVGVVPVSLLEAPVQGAIFTWEITKATAIALVGFFASVFTLSADLSQVSGPVGIAGAVGQASSNGLAALLGITALISINLALINILPIPALDGGRLLFVAIEAVTRRPIKPVVANAVNTVGFGFLVLLMVVVTASDIFKLF